MRGASRRTRSQSFIVLARTGFKERSYELLFVYMLKNGAVGSWVLAAGWVPLLAGCGSDNDGSRDNGSAPPNLVLEGDFTVMSPDDLAVLKGATEITGSLVIQGQTITSLTG